MEEVISSKIQEHQLISPYNIIFSCVICQRTIGDIYPDPQSRYGPTDGRLEVPCKMWITECSHLTCSEHLEGGGAPFHRPDEQPKAPCPLCSKEKNDARPKRLYALWGPGKDDHDSNLPTEWFNTPQIKLDDETAAMSALRFQYLALARYGMMMHKRFNILKSSFISVNSHNDQVSKELRKAEIEIGSMKDQLEVYKEKVQRHNEAAPGVKYYIRNLAALAQEHAMLQKQLLALGYDVPDSNWSFSPGKAPKPSEDRSAGMLNAVPPSQAQPMGNAQHQNRHYVSGDNGTSLQDARLAQHKQSFNIMPDQIISSHKRARVVVDDESFLIPTKRSYLSHKHDSNMNNSNHKYDDTALAAVTDLQSRLPPPSAQLHAPSRHGVPPNLDNFRYSDGLREANTVASNIQHRDRPGTFAAHQPPIQKHASNRQEPALMKLFERPEVMQSHSAPRRDQNYVYDGFQQDRHQQDQYPSKYSPHHGLRPPLLTSDPPFLRRLPQEVIQEEYRKYPLDRGPDSQAHLYPKPRRDSLNPKPFVVPHAGGSFSQLSSDKGQNETSHMNMNLLSFIGTPYTTDNQPVNRHNTVRASSNNNKFTFRGPSRQPPQSASMRYAPHQRDIEDMRTAPMPRTQRVAQNTSSKRSIIRGPLTHSSSAIGLPTPSSLDQPRIHTTAGNFKWDRPTTRNNHTSNGGFYRGQTYHQK